MDKQGFEQKVTAALADRQLRRNIRSAMDGLMLKRQAVFDDPDEFERLRARGQVIKQHALQNLPDLLERLERNCTRNGIQVHWARTTHEANRIVLDILREHGAGAIVKGKSMVSEEMHLNAFLARHDIEALETDLGEFIIQLNGETPSHIIVPAVHKNKREIARIFHEKLPDTPYTEAVEELNAIARDRLRRKFSEAKVGLSGVNFAVAETGTLCLVENEGNGRMCTTLPDVHIAVMGIEKVVPRLSDIPPLLRLLTGSATGQLITTYVNMITSPRKAGEKDGPKEVHLVLLDNGRSKILSDPQLRQTLQCIRCGTCLNHCPVYTRIGGHAYGFVYPGPIGKILNPQMAGLEQAGVLATASSLCNACEEVCPVKIPIPELLRRLRRECNEDRPAAPLAFVLQAAELITWKGWQLVNTHPGLNRLVGRAAALLGRHLPNMGPLRQWRRYRAAPQVAARSLHELAKDHGVPDE
jgi:L-lactate dehydrogenase complex protein LldF